MAFLVPDTVVVTFDISSALKDVLTQWLNQQSGAADIRSALSAIDTKLTALLQQGATTMADIHDVEAAVTALNDKVTAEETVEQSIITLVSGIAAELKTALANSDPTQALAQIQAISDKLSADTQAMADAVAANTTPPPAP